MKRNTETLFSKQERKRLVKLQQAVLAKDAYYSAMPDKQLQALLKDENAMLFDIEAYARHVLQKHERMKLVLDVHEKCARIAQLKRLYFIATNRCWPNHLQRMDELHKQCQLVNGSLAVYRLQSVALYKALKDEIDKEMARSLAKELLMNKEKPPLVQAQCTGVLFPQTSDTAPPVQVMQQPPKERFIALAVQDTSFCRRVLYTACLLVLYRLGCSVPVPFVDVAEVAAVFASGWWNIYSMMSGGGLSSFSVFALGVSPAVSASIVLSLWSCATPEIARCKKTNPKQYAIWENALTLLFSVVAGCGIYAVLRANGLLLYAKGGAGLVAAGTIIMTLMAGAQLVRLLCQTINRIGVGQGSGIIIVAGIITQWSGMAAPYKALLAQATSMVFIILMAWLVLLLSLVAVVVLQTAQHHIKVQYLSNTGTVVDGAITTPILATGAMPVIMANMAVGVVCIGAEQIANLFAIQTVLFNSTGWLYCLFYAVFICVMNYLYLSLSMDTTQFSNVLAQRGGVIPCVRAGSNTVQYLGRSVLCISVIGGVALSGVAIVPVVFQNITGVAIPFAGTELILICGVVLQIAQQAKSYLAIRHLDGAFVPQKEGSKCQ